MDRPNTSAGTQIIHPNLPVRLNSLHTLQVYHFQSRTSPHPPRHACKYALSASDTMNPSTIHATQGKLLPLPTSQIQHTTATLRRGPDPARTSRVSVSYSPPTRPSFPHIRSTPAIYQSNSLRTDNAYLSSPNLQIFSDVDAIENCAACVTNLLKSGNPPTHFFPTHTLIDPLTCDTLSMSWSKRAELSRLLDSNATFSCQTKLSNERGPVTVACLHGWFGLVTRSQDQRRTPTPGARPEISVPRSPKSDSFLFLLLLFDSSTPNVHRGLVVNSHLSPGPRVSSIVSTTPNTITNFSPDRA
jgi:hypothetical protein